MHCLDLGISQVLLGNVLFELFGTMGGAVTNPRKTLADMTVLIHAAGKALDQHDPPIQMLTIGMIKRKDGALLL